MSDVSDSSPVCRAQPGGGCFRWERAFPSPAAHHAVPIRAGAGTPRDGGGSAIRLSRQRKIHLGGAGLGRGQGRWQEEGRGGAAPPGARYKPMLRSEERVRSLPRPRPAPAAPAPLDSAGGSAGAAGPRLLLLLLCLRLRLRSGAPRALPGTRAGGGCPDGVLCPQAQDLLPAGRALSEEPRGSAREFVFLSPDTAPAAIPPRFLREKTRQRRGRKKGSREGGES